MTHGSMSRRRRKPAAKNCMEITTKSRSPGRMSDPVRACQTFPDRPCSVFQRVWWGLSAYAYARGRENLCDCRGIAVRKVVSIVAKVTALCGLPSTIHRLPRFLS